MKRARTSLLMASADAPPPSGEPENSTTRLVRGMRAGDSSAFEGLYARIAPAVFAWANLRIPRHLRAACEPEELVQEVFCRALHRFETYDSERAPFRVWVFRIAGNTLLEVLRKAARNQPSRAAPPGGRLLPLEDVPDEALSVTRRVTRDEGLSTFLAEVAHLDPDEKRLLLYRGLEGLPHSEVAERLGISVEATHKRWQRLRSRFEASRLPEALLLEP